MATATATETARDWSELPIDVLYLIFRNLTSFEILWPAQAVCRPWREVSLEPRLWRRLDMRYHAEFVNQAVMDKLMREAVDRSGGHVNEVYDDVLGTNEILSYIADRSTGVKFLSLQCTTGIDGEGLVEFVRRCPLMEELQIESLYFSPETYGGIGRACPHLKRFRLINIFSFTDPWCDEDAHEIANNMPLLRELQLYGNPLTNTGLANILSKCRHLESLVLRACYHLRLDEGMKANMNARIKNVKLPRLRNLGKMGKMVLDFGNLSEVDKARMGSMIDLLQIRDSLFFMMGFDLAFDLGHFDDPAPAENYPHLISKESFLGRFPYFLPNFCISALAIFASVSCLWLPETLHTHHRKGKGDGPTESSEGRPSSSLRSLLTNWPLMSSVIVYCVFSIHDMAYSEIIPLWAVSDRKHGGLSFTSRDIGIVLGISGFCVQLTQLLFYSSIERRFGPIKAARAAAILSIPVLTTFPFISKLSGVGLFSLITCASMVKLVLSMTIITGTFVLQNNAVTQDQRGAANGLSMTMQSICKALGPAAAGYL